MPSAQSELSLPCQALTHHIPQKMERNKVPVPNNWILSAKRLGRRVLGFYLLSSHLKPCLCHQCGLTGDSLSCSGKGSLVLLEQTEPCREGAQGVEAEARLW